MKCEIPVSKGVYVAMVDLCYLCYARGFDHMLRIMIEEFCNIHRMSSPLKMLSEVDE